MPIPLTYSRVPGFTHPTIHLPITVCYACIVCNLQSKQRCVGKSLHIRCCSPYANIHPQGFKESFVDTESRCVKVVRRLLSTMVYWYRSFDDSIIAKRMAPRVDWPLQEEQSVKAEGLTILCYILRTSFHPELESHKCMIRSRSIFWHWCRTCRIHHSNSNSSADWTCVFWC